MTTKVTNLNIDTTTITSVGTLTSLTVTGNVTGNYFIGNGSQLTGLATPTSVATVTASAQPNITSVGTLTALTVSGNSNLGAVGNVKITGGTTGQYVKTDGTGNLSFGTVVMPDIMHPFLLGL